MKAIETPSTPENKNVKTHSHLSGAYQKVQDGRKQPIRGLWLRGQRYYARLSVETESGEKQVRWIPLTDDQTKEPVSTVPQAVAALGRLKVLREDNGLPVLKRTPKLSE